MKNVSLMGVFVTVAVGCAMFAQQAHVWALGAFVVANCFAVLCNQRLVR